MTDTHNTVSANFIEPLLSHRNSGICNDITNVNNSHENYFSYPHVPLLIERQKDTKKGRGIVNGRLFRAQCPLS